MHDNAYPKWIFKLACLVGFLLLPISKQYILQTNTSLQRCWFPDNILQLVVQTEEIYTNNVKVVKTVYSSVNMPAFCRVKLICV